MTRTQLVRYVAKPAIFVVALVPLTKILFDGVTGGLGAEPIRELQLRTGWWTLTLLLVTLSVSPLRRLTGWNELIRFRRMIGLFAFFYAVLHFTNYVGVDQFFSWPDIVEDIVKRPWITIGFTALVTLVPLAATSTQRMVRRLGKRWGQLHRLIYVAAACGVLHYLWLVKKDTRGPVLFALVLVLLLAMRLRLPRSTGSRPATTAAPLPARVTVESETVF
ncbi:MAG: sulfoxide reductase heme-binding subunit YedZ [Gemmatimonadetes bacterium]|nr:sulfoxide reductase heme-binding subunit YedZ [Gemmatimonadota bacterium]